jgi:heat shock protein HtpX
LVLGAFVVASYVVTPVAVLVVVVHAGHLRGSDALILTISAVAALLGATAFIMVLAWRGLPRVLLRTTGARAPRADETARLREPLAAVALARGVAEPQIWVVDDDAPNAFAIGCAQRWHVCVTSGALRLPHDELEALCAFTVTAITCRPFAYCTAAIDVVLLAEVFVGILWVFGSLLLVSPAAGVPFAAVAVIALCQAALIAVTRLALVIADRALPQLLDDATGIVDLEAIACTEQPLPFTRLLRRVDEDGARVASSWTVAHLWFDRDERDNDRRVRFGPPELALRCEQ